MPTSKKDTSKAAKLLSRAKTPKGVKSVAGSDLSQRVFPRPGRQGDEDDAGDGATGRGGDSDDLRSTTTLWRSTSARERKREEVTIPRKDGSRQKYAAVRFKQEIDRAREQGTLVTTVARIIRRPTLGLGHLDAAGRHDLMLENLVLDQTKPYHSFFTTKTIERPGRGWKTTTRRAGTHPEAIVRLLR
jgi:hypothetical protein